HAVGHLGRAAQVDAIAAAGKQVEVAQGDAFGAAQGNEVTPFGVRVEVGVLVVAFAHAQGSFAFALDGDALDVGSAEHGVGPAFERARSGGEHHAIFQDQLEIAAQDDGSGDGQLAVGDVD